MNTKSSPQQHQVDDGLGGMGSGSWHRRHGLLAVIAAGTLASALTGCGSSPGTGPQLAPHLAAPAQAPQARPAPPWPERGLFTATNAQLLIAPPHDPASLTKRDRGDFDPPGCKFKSPECGDGPLYPPPAPGQHYKVKFSYQVPKTLILDWRSTGGGIVEPSSGIMQSKPVVVYNACPSGQDSSVAQWTWTFTDGTAPVTSAACKVNVSRTLSSQWHQLAATLTATYKDGTSASVTQPVQYRDLVIASMGDSAASGQGDPDHARIKKGSFSNMECDRSGWAASARAAAKLQDNSTSVTFWHMACAGARIISDHPTSYAGSSLDQGGMLSPYSGAHHTRQSYPLPSQVDQLQDLAQGVDRPVDAALFTLGANDTMWADAAENCYAIGDFCIGDYNQMLTNRVALLPGRLDQLGKKLDSMKLADGRPIIPRSNVYLTEYFDPVHDASPSGFAENCPSGAFGLIPPLSRRVREWASYTVQTPMDNKLRSAAIAQKWHFIDGITAAFHDHGLCAPQNQRWITTPNESAFNQPYYGPPTFHDDINGAWHANDVGQRKMADIMGQYLKSLPEGPPLPTPPAPATHPTVPLPHPHPVPPVCMHKPYLPVCSDGFAPLELHPYDNKDQRGL